MNKTLTQIIQKFIDLAAHTLSTKSVAISEAELEKDTLIISTGNKKFSVRASAIYDLLENVFQNSSGFKTEKLYQANNRDQSIFVGVHFRDEGQAMLPLIGYLASNGSIEEARLCSIQSQIIEDFRKGITQNREQFTEGVKVGKDLFGKLKLNAEKQNQGSSLPAIVEKLLPFLEDKNDCEVLYAADHILENFPEALFEVSGKRKEKLTAALKNAPKILSERSHPLFKSYSKLFANLLEIILAN